jgi:histidine ammonia-lyase/phenylalanine ammonia-lyase
MLDGYRLSLNDIAHIATQPGSRVIELSDRALARMDASVRVRDKLISSGEAIYGGTTGFGDSSNHQIGSDRAAELQRNLLRFLRVGTGPSAPDDIVRATMLIRANCAARGNSGVREQPVRLLLQLLRNEILPVVPERGSVGASGDLAPLSYIAAALTGEGTVRCRGQEVPAADALRASGLVPVELEAKEGLALVNGTSFMTAYAVLACGEAAELTWAAELCTALAAQLRRGSSDQFAAFPHTHRPHPGQVRSAAVIRGLLAGSALTVHDTDLNGTALASNPMSAGTGYVELERHLQDPYSIRCAPHVIGVLRDTLDWAASWLTTEINSSNDNPLFDAATQTSHNSGNFYGGHVAQAAQAVSTAVASVADLLDRQLQVVVDAKYNNGLPANLVVPVELDHPAAGLHHGFKGAQIAASALTAEALHLTMPVSSFSRSTESHNQDKVSMGTIAARHARTVVQLTSEVAAIQLLALCQAADLVGPGRLSTATRDVHAYVREHAAFVTADRPMDTEIRHVATLLRSGALRAAVGGSP